MAKLWGTMINLIITLIGAVIVGALITFAITCLVGQAMDKLECEDEYE